MKKDKLFTKFNFILIIVTISTIIRLFFLFTTPNYYNEESPAYVRDAMRMLNTKHFPVWHNHPGGYQLVLSVFIFIFKNVFSAVFTSRLFSLILGVASLIYYFILCKKLFGKTVSIVSTIVLTLSMQHIILSVNTLSYMPLYFGLICGIYYLIRYIELNKRRDYFLSIVSISFACMMRQEAWLIIPIMFLILLYKKQYLNSILYALICFVYPIIYMIRSYMMFKNPVEFYYVGGGFDSFVNFVDFNMISSFTKYLIVNYPGFLFVLGIIGMLYSSYFAIKKYSHKTIIILFFAVNYVFYQIMVMSHNFIFISSYGKEFTRYSFIFIIFLIPFTIDIIYKILIKFTKKKQIISFGLFLIMIPYILSAYHNYSISPYINGPPTEYYNLRDYLKENIHDDTVLYIATKTPQTISYAVTETNKAYRLSYFITPESFHEFIKTNYSSESLYNIQVEHLNKEIEPTTNYLIIYDNPILSLPEINTDDLLSFYNDVHFKKININGLIVLRPKSVQK